MTEQQRPDEEVEGHARRLYEEPEGEGAEASEEDTEGHGRKFQQSEDDVEGHGRKFQQSDEDDDDVEGHSPARRPV